MKTKDEQLIKDIYALTTKLYYGVADDNMLRCGHPGVAGIVPSHEFSASTGTLMGAKEALTQAMKKIITNNS